jgi:hypothetical protein
LHYTTSASHTVSLTLHSQNDISTATFIDMNTYAKQMDIKKAAIQNTIQYSALCRADVGGAEMA